MINHPVPQWVDTSSPEAPLRLFCFPHAGGGSLEYRKWHQTCHPNVAICTVQLPGRDGRLSEPAFSSMGLLVQALHTAILPWLDRPAAFFGHSMGAWIAFELCRSLGPQGPQHLFVSARRAPHLPDTRAPLYTLHDQAFIEALQRRYQAIPPALLNSPELLKIFLPTLRADITLLDRYVHQNRAPLERPITAFSGREDSLVSEEEMIAWKTHTTGKFVHNVLPGGHFFYNQSRELLLEKICKTLLSPSEP